MSDKVCDDCRNLVEACECADDVKADRAGKHTAVYVTGNGSQEQRHFDSLDELATFLESRRKDAQAFVYAGHITPRSYTVRAKAFVEFGEGK